MNGEQGKTKGAWRVIRQDSNGVQVVEADRLTEVAARVFAERRAVQIGHHKQTVWHEAMPKEEGSGPSPSNSPSREGRVGENYKP
jgi:hypothetical protein